MSTQTIQLHNIPSQPTRFIGREPEIAEIVALLQDENCRLLTLLGSGGMGKTRLAIESVQRLSVDDFEHGVFYVPLAPLTSAYNIVTTIISVLGIMIGDENTPQQELVKFLRGRNVLLVMDNFEHVLAGADLVADILNNTSNIKILVTSRELLNLQMEWVWHVKGMRFPDARPDDIDLYSALKLFIDRGRRVRRDFEVDAQLDCAVRICQLVGGMPLAIELAASWLKTLSCADIIKQIDQGIDFLSTRTRDIPERHRSIRAVFDYSWDLLSVDEQAVFPRLSVFRGGFTLEASENIANADLMTLSGLVEKSMVRRDANGRYEVHELLRQYAEEQLQAIGAIEQALSAHTTYFARFMEEHANDIKGQRQLEGLNEIEADFDNVVEVWNRAIINKNYESLEGMMEGLALFCDMRALYQAGNDLFAYAVDTLQGNDNIEDKPVWHNLLIRQAQVWILQGTPNEQILQRVKENHLIVHKNYEQLLNAHYLWTIGEFYRETRRQSQFEDNLLKAIELHEKGLTIYESLGETYYVGRIFRALTSCYWSIGDSEKFLEFNLQCLQLTSQIGDRTGMAHATFHAIGTAWTTRRFDTYRQKLIDAETIFREMGDRKSVAVVMSYRAEYEILYGDFRKVGKLAHEAMIEAKTTNYPLTILRTLEIIIFLHILDEDYQVAQTMLDNMISIDNGYVSEEICVLSSLIAIGLGDIPAAKTYLQRGLRYLREETNTNSQFVLLKNVSFYLLTISRMLAIEHNYHYAVELLSLAFHNPYGINGIAENWAAISQLRTDLEVELGAEAYQFAWDRRAQLDLDTTIDELLVYLGDDNMPESSTPKPQPLAEPLTAREVEVLALVAYGLTNPQIADKLYLSVGTVKVHTRNIYGKLNVSNRTEASTKARNLKLI